MQLLSRSRRALVLFLALGLVALSAPAQAALPSSTPSAKHRCANGKTAKTWIKFAPGGRMVTRLAADNPCKGQWVRFHFYGLSETNPYGRSLFVAPGQRLDWDGDDLAEWGLADWIEDETGETGLVDPTETCARNFYEADFGWSNYDGILFFSAKDVRAAPDCGEPIPKYSPNHYAQMRCPSSAGEIRMSWKTEGKKVVKLAMSNSCAWDDAIGIAWWKLDNGRTVGVWVDPEEGIDLWKADFGKLPVKTKDGQVHLKTQPYADQEDAFRSDAKNRPVYYNGFVHNDTVTCNAGQKSC